MVHSDPEAIAVFIRSMRRMSSDRAETGATSTWLWTELNRLGLPVICIDARHAKAALKMQINKSDRNDAVGIARIMQCGWYKEVRVKGLDSHAVKACWQPRAARQDQARSREPDPRALEELGSSSDGKDEHLPLRAAELTEIGPTSPLRSRRCSRHESDRAADCGSRP